MKGGHDGAITAKNKAELDVNDDPNKALPTQNSPPVPSRGTHFASG